MRIYTLSELRKELTSIEDVSFVYSKPRFITVRDYKKSLMSLLLQPETLCKRRVRKLLNELDGICHVCKREMFKGETTIIEDNIEIHSECYTNDRETKVSHITKK